MLKEFTITDMVRSLNLRKQIRTSTVLILGSRTGGLFRSQHLYTLLEPHADSTFSTLPKLKQFAECYRLLTRRQSPGFSSNETYGIVTNALNTINITNADKYLADLVRAGVFDTIITTNVDTLIEDALVARKWKNTRDFEVLSLPSTDHCKLDYQQRTPCRIIYIFGQVASRAYKIQERPGFLRQQPQWINLLSDLFSRNVMAVGLDPVWDNEIYQAFPFIGGSPWFINEETLSEDSGLYHMVDARNGRTFTGENANYERFMELLHRAFFSTNSLGQDDMLSDNQDMPSGEENKSGRKSNPPDLDDDRNNGEHSERTEAKKPLKIFISSVSQDEVLLHALLTHITALKHENLVDAWYSHKILAGQVIQTEVDHHLQSAALILLLVSADFLASDYINSVELKRAMELHNAGNAQVIPIILRPCCWQGAAFGGLKALPSNGQPVTLWANQDSALDDIVQGIRDVASTLL